VKVCVETVNVKVAVGGTDPVGVRVKVAVGTV